MTFEGKAAIVTGASSGIGRATARRLVELGGSVLAVGRDAAALQALAGETGARERCAPFVADLTEAEGPPGIVAAAVERYGGLDIVVNAAGIIAMGTVESTSDADWDGLMDINVRAPFRLLRAALPHLVARRGCVVNVSSVNGLRAFAGLVAYNVSKAALDHLTRCAALEMAPSGVRINAVNPGVTVTNLHRRMGMGEDQYSAFLERSKETHPLGRPGRPDEVAELVVFLASGRSGWLTGETIAIDGGRHLTCAR